MKNYIVTLEQWYLFEEPIPYKPSKEEFLNSNLQEYAVGLSRHKCIINNKNYSVYFDNKKGSSDSELRHKIILSESEFEFLKIKLL